VERALGRAKTAGFFILLALDSNSLDSALAQGGVGLSGIWLWSTRSSSVSLEEGQTLPRHYRLANGNAFRRVVFLSLHICHRHTRVECRQRCPWCDRASTTAVDRGGRVVAIVLFGLFAATFERPRLNFSKTSDYEEEKGGYDDLQADHHREALRWLRDAVAYQPNVPGFWSNLGIAYSRLRDASSAVAPYARAHQLEPDDPVSMRPAEKAD
jgi:tetratricopeptide (TPR) repeat protein